MVLEESEDQADDKDRHMIRSAKLKNLQAEMPGFSLLLTYVAGLPLRELDVTVRAMGRERLSSLHESLLKCVDRGVNTLGLIDTVLGAGTQLIKHGLAFLHSLDLVEETAELGVDGTLAFVITERGRLALRDAGLRRPVTWSVPCSQDAITGQLVVRRKRARLASAAMISSGAVYALPSRFTRPRAGELEKSDLRRVVRELARGDGGKSWEGDVLDILAIERAQEKYRIVDIAVFENDAGVLAFRVLDRGARLREYDPILGAMAELNPEVVPSEIGTVRAARRTAAQWLSPEELALAAANAEALEELQEKIDAVDSAVREASAIAPEGDVGEARVTTREQLELALQEAERLRIERDRLIQDRADKEEELERGVRRISSEEHLQWLEKAFKHAKERVVVISPWLSPDAINTEFKRWVVDALDRGVTVILGWGYPDEGSDQVKKRQRSIHVAQKLVDHVMNSHSGTKRGKVQPADRAELLIVELGDTHSKILVADQTFAVVSSFNFLSYRGARKDGNLRVRDERGIRIGIPGKVKEILDQELERLERARLSGVGLVLSTHERSASLDQRHVSVET